jgi:hypothetical protein
MRLWHVFMLCAPIVACSSSRLQTAETPAAPAESSDGGSEDKAKDEDDEIVFGEERTKETTIAILPPEDAAKDTSDAGDDAGTDESADATDDGTDYTSAIDGTDDTTDEMVDESPPPPPELNETNKTIRDFARDNLDKQVGNGLCQALQDGALTAAAASLGANTATLSSSAFGLRGLRLLEDEKVLPGDILHWEGGTNYNNFPASGNPADFEPINPAHLAFVDVDLGHVAIVETVSTAEFEGRDVAEVTILHQNINNVKLVKRHTIWLDPAMISVGSIKVYRPEPN